MTNKQAAVILQEHIDTYNYQLSNEGWRKMVQMGVVTDTLQERLLFRKDAKIQMEAYQIAIKALLDAN